MRKESIKPTDAREQLIQIIAESNNPKLFAVMGEALEMIKQGKSNEEIEAHFGISK
jgi:hypothetical protein